jgi:UDPglucose 6-dehydrogenase
MSLIGARNVGLTMAACLAEVGHQVRCADNDEARVSSLRGGPVPFFDPHFEKPVLTNAKVISAAVE